MSQARRTFSRNRLIGLGLIVVQQLNSVITTGETGKPDEKQSIDCVLITKENADKLDNFVLSE